MVAFGGRTPGYADFVQAVRAYAPSHLVEYVARVAAERGGWDVRIKKGMLPPWAVAAMVRDCIVSSNEGRSGQLTERKLVRLFNLFNEAHDERGTDVQSLLTPILYEQFPYQQSQYEEIIRSIALYEDAYPGCQSWPWTDVLGAPVSDLTTLALIIHTVVMQNAGEYAVSSAIQEVVDMLGYSDSLPEIADGLTRTIPEMKEAAIAVTPPHAPHRRFAYNPLLRTPLVATERGVFAPVPELIYDSVSPSVLYHRGRDAWGDAFTRDLGSRVQQYAGRQLKLLAPDFALIPEIRYDGGQLSADWLLVSDELLVIVECKASRASLDARLGTRALDNQFRRDIGKAKRQIERTADLIAERHADFAVLHGDRQVIGLILTAEPFYLLAATHSEKLLAGTPTLLGSLRDLEHLTTLDGPEALRQLQSIAADPEKRTWPLGNSLDVPSNSVAHNPILQSVWERSPLAEPVSRRLADTTSAS